MSLISAYQFIDSISLSNIGSWPFFKLSISSNGIFNDANIFSLFPKNDKNIPLAVIDYLNNLSPTKGFIYKNYCPTATKKLVDAGYDFSVRVLGTSNLQGAMAMKEQLVSLLSNTNKTVINTVAA